MHIGEVVVIRPPAERPVVSIGLDGVVAQQHNYKKSGFNLAYRNIRYEGDGGRQSLPALKTVNLCDLPFETVASYDKPFFPEERSNFIKSWINQEKCYSLGILQDGKLSGYGVIRKCRVGYKIGPLFADNPETAESLFLSLKSKVESTNRIFMDIPEVNQSAIALAERYDMEVSFETARMYKGKAPDIPLDRLFGVTSFEIG